MKTAWIVAILVLVVAVSCAYADKAEPTVRLGIGIGGTTGGLGVMGEMQSKSPFAPIASIGLAVASSDADDNSSTGFAWEIGAHIYTGKQTQAKHKGMRFTVQYGTGYYAEPSESQWGGFSSVVSGTGLLLGFGYQGYNWSIDAIGPITGGPAGYEKARGIGIGYMF